MRSLTLSRTRLPKATSQKRWNTMFHKMSRPFNHSPVVCADASAAVSCIESGDTVFIHTAAAAPLPLIRALTGLKEHVRNVQIVHLHIDANGEYQDPKFTESFYDNNFFTGAHAREAVRSGHSGYVPVFLSEVAKLITKGVFPLDVALIQISPPDKHGYCSLGVSIDVSIDALTHARKVVALINPHMPRTHGEGVVHISSVDYVYTEATPLPGAKSIELGPVETAIGGHIASLIEDGDCLQLGIGGIPDAVLAALGNRNNLGLHSEMISSSVVPLLKKGIMNNSQKKNGAGISVVSFCRGNQELYDFIDDNPSVQFRRTSYVNDPRIISENPKMVAINSAIEIDLTGQVCADSIGPYIFSGIGGQVDFVAGSILSEGGKPIIAMPSTTHNGKSRIVACLSPGAGVVTTRGHVRYVVTEYGIANLEGTNLQQRLHKLLQIAHPDHREGLEKQFLELYGWSADWKRWHGFGIDKRRE